MPGERTVQRKHDKSFVQNFFNMKRCAQDNNKVSKQWESSVRSMLPKTGTTLHKYKNSEKEMEAIAAKRTQLRHLDELKYFCFVFMDAANIAEL